MANKINEVQILREYCERRWDNQDKYYEACLSRLNKNIILGLVLMFIFMVGTIIGFAHDVTSLQTRVDHIEQTWSE